MNAGTLINITGLMMLISAHQVARAMPWLGIAPNGFFYATMALFGLTLAIRAFMIAHEMLVLGEKL